ncbi:hypothetical protein P5673_029281 [Acropora cervicornis]|uniref:Uncharacterized protein n=1 Tax=Acropora cervicornis TaxID=6130 RepID=A0AAD9PVX9_ACRCE|nr:hypothetical protein P5673_029281 [Acropora cervicornis]
MQKTGISACSWQDKKKVNFFTTNCLPNAPCVSAHKKYMGGVHYTKQKRGDHKMPVNSHRWYHYQAIFYIETAPSTICWETTAHVKDHWSHGSRRRRDTFSHKTAFKSLHAVCQKWTETSINLTIFFYVRCVTLHCVLPALSHSTYSNTDAL